MEKKDQIVITTVKDRLCCCYLENGKLYDVVFSDSKKEHSGSVGDIFAGRVENIIPNIQAAFVRISKDETGYLPLTKEELKNIRCGQEKIVQIKKAAVKTKQAVLTCYPELVGRCCVVTGGRKGVGISKKITDESIRDTLSRLADTCLPDFMHLVFRTNAAELPADTVKEEILRSVEVLQKIYDKADYTKAPALLREAVPFYLRFIRNIPIERRVSILTDNPGVYKVLSEEYPEAILYQDTSYSLDHLYSLSSTIEKALSKKVWLKSGGTLIIEPTEALTVIDVNTGKAIQGKRNKETTFYKVNLEAAREAARQIRLRNLSGMILIDFIDMEEEEHIKSLIYNLKKELEQDPTQCTFIDITKLGLVELTRRKTHLSLPECLKQG